MVQTTLGVVAACPVSNGTSVTRRLYSVPDQGVSFFGFSSVGSMTFADAKKANAFIYAIGKPTRLGNWNLMPFAAMPEISAKKKHEAQR
jgi:hypothetical protein